MDGAFCHTHLTHAQTKLEFYEDNFDKKESSCRDRDYRKLQKEKQTMALQAHMNIFVPG